MGKMTKRRVLIVEDDAMSLRAWETVFGRRGWEVQLAGSVVEALEMLQPAPDFLILDLRLPDGSGEEVLRRVREDGLKTRVAVTTGSDDSQELRLVHELRPEAVIEKPVNVAELWCEAG